MKQEMLNFYDENGEIIGTGTEEEALRQGYFINIAQVWIFDNSDNLIMTQRAKTETDSGKFDVCSGHIRANEMPSDGAKRELKEELGIASEESRNLDKLCRIKKDFGTKGRFLLDEYFLRLDRDISTLELTSGEIEKVVAVPYEMAKAFIESKYQRMRIPYCEETIRIFEKIDQKIEGRSR